MVSQRREVESNGYSLADKQMESPSCSGVGVYVISVVAALVSVHPQTLRNYERSGLLAPSRSVGGVRRFSDDDVARVKRIVELSEAGVNLEGVRHILALEVRFAELEGR